MALNHAPPPPARARAFIVHSVPFPLHGSAPLIQRQADFDAEVLANVHSVSKGGG